MFVAHEIGFITACWDPNCVRNYFCKELTYFAWLGRREFRGKEDIKRGRRKSLNLLISKSMLWHRFAILKYDLKFCKFEFGIIYYSVL